ncbi:MAG: aminotransferase class I/II-fold pyridoxal phosphate-dependent enzyme [Eubacteriales bacterium]|nr:aminotransferase class I/II-fold pyridoxal phosphate-dependent enzyme [Eubacteriales bacterium]
MLYNFMNDYNECAHERILEAITRANREQDNSYGLDTRCERAREKIRAHLDGAASDVQFLVGGTQTNTTIIAACLKPYQGVIAAASGHINVHETGAIEATGHKVLALPSADGKLTAEQIERAVAAHFADETAEHMVQPGMVYLSQPTELGTIYRKAELTDIWNVCQRYQIPLYVDGARLGASFAAQGADLSLADLARYTSAFSIGGTKLGALFGEALVINDPLLKKDFRYHIKQRGGMLAKGRLLGIQFETLFTDGLYFEIGRHAVAQAQKLTEGLRARGYAMMVESPTNQVFPILPKTLLRELGRSFGYAFWCAVDDENDAVRFCTSWATPPEMVDALLGSIPAKQ